MFDNTSVKAAELMSYFGRNTAIELRHNYGSNELEIVATRTKNVIITVDLSYDADLYELAHVIMAMKKFPKARKMNRSWSPIRLTAKAQADNEISRATMAWHYA